MSEYQSPLPDDLRRFAAADGEGRPISPLPPWLPYAIAGAALALLLLLAWPFLAGDRETATQAPRAAPTAQVAPAVAAEPVVVTEPTAQVVPTALPGSVIEPIDCAAPRSESERQACRPPAAPAAPVAPAPVIVSGGRAAPPPVVVVPEQPREPAELIPIVEYGAMNGGGGSWNDQPRQAPAFCFGCSLQGGEPAPEYGAMNGGGGSWDDQP